MGQDHIWLERDQFGGVPANFGGIGRGPADVNLHVAADDPARLLQSLQERIDTDLKLRIVRGCGRDNADSPHALALLRAPGAARRPWPHTEMI